MGLFTFASRKHNIVYVISLYCKSVPYLPLLCGMVPVVLTCFSLTEVLALALAVKR